MTNRHLTSILSPVFAIANQPCLPPEQPNSLVCHVFVPPISLLLNKTHIKSTKPDSLTQQITVKHVSNTNKQILYHIHAILQCMVCYGSTTLVSCHCGACCALCTIATKNAIAAFVLIIRHLYYIIFCCNRGYCY